MESSGGENHLISWGGGRVEIIDLETVLWMPEIARGPSVHDTYTTYVRGSKLPNDDDSGELNAYKRIRNFSNVGWEETWHNIRFGQSGLRNWNMGTSDWDFGLLCPPSTISYDDGIVELMANAPFEKHLVCF